MWAVRPLRSFGGRATTTKACRFFSSNVDTSSVRASVFAMARPVSAIDTGKKTVQVVPGGVLNINLAGVKANVEIFPTWTDKCEIQVDVINPAWYRLRYQSRIDAMEKGSDESDFDDDDQLPDLNALEQLELGFEVTSSKDGGQVDVSYDMNDPDVRQLYVESSLVQGSDRSSSGKLGRTLQGLLGGMAEPPTMDEFLKDTVAHIRMYVPQSFNVNVKTMEGHVTILDKLEGNVCIENARGEVAVSKVKGDDITLISTDGLVRVKHSIAAQNLKMEGETVEAVKVMAKNAIINSIPDPKGLSSSVGRVRIESLYCPSSVIKATGDASVDIMNLHGAMTVTTNEGDITVGEVNGHIKLLSQRGDILAHLESPELKKVSQVHSLHGNVKVSLDPRVQLGFFLRHGREPNLPGNVVTDRLQWSHMYGVAYPTADKDTATGSKRTGKINLGSAHFVDSHVVPSVVDEDNAHNSDRWANDEERTMDTPTIDGEAREIEYYSEDSGRKPIHMTPPYLRHPKVSVLSLNGQIDIERTSWKKKMRKKFGILWT